MNALKAQLGLGWSHYVVLLSVSNLQERSFYALEAQQASWGVCELKRQIASGLFERLALSRSKDEVKALAQTRQALAVFGQYRTNPEDFMRKAARLICVSGGEGQARLFCR